MDEFQARPGHLQNEMQDPEKMSWGDVFLAALFKKDLEVGIDTKCRRVGKGTMPFLNSLRGALGKELISEGNRTSTSEERREAAKGKDL